MEWPMHGGQPRRVMERLGLQPEGKLIDFSANLNPLGSPAWLDDAWAEAVEALRAYPDPEYAEAHQAIAEAQGLEPSQVLLTNGGAEAIFLAAQLFAGGTAAVVHPAFSEYERACAAFRTRVIRLYADAFERYALPPEATEQALSKCDVLFVCRPCNPTGTVWNEAEAAHWLERAEAAGTTVVVDEAFYDFLPEPQRPLTRLLERFPNLILLRSYTKMFAVPGLRLGYALASRERIARMRALQLPWSVSGAAASFVPWLAKDEAFVARTVEYVRRERRRVTDALAGLGYACSASEANYYVLRDPFRRDSDGLLRFLLEDGIAARHTHTFHGLEGATLRLAVRATEDNDRLIERLREWRSRR